MNNLGDNRKCTLQWYIYKPLEKWFSKPLKKICAADDALIYDRLTYPTHRSFKKIRYVEINCSVNQAIRVKDCVNRMINECQYKMPWISQTTYYLEYNIHCAKKLKNIKAKLVEIDVWHYLLNKDKLSIEWFGKKDILVFQFSSKLKGWKKDEVDLQFRFSVDDNAKENLLFITKPLPFHRANIAPSPMFMMPLFALDGQYMRYLSVEDILSLELAYNDHRFGPPDSYFIQDIQRNLRSKLQFLNNTETKNCILVNNFKTPEVLNYFIFKYHKYFNKFYVPNILTQHDRVSMSRLFDIKVLNKQNYNITTNFMYPDKTRLFVINYKTFGNRANNFKVVEDNPFTSRLPYKFDYTIKRGLFRKFPKLTAPLYNTNEYIEIYIKNQHEYGSKYINDVFQIVVDQFRHHDRGQCKLICGQLDLEQIRRDTLSDVFKIFDCIELQQTKPTDRLVEILTCYMPFRTVFNLTDCRLTNKDVVDLCLKLPRIVPQINIMGDNDLDATVYIEIILAYYNETLFSLDPISQLNIANNRFPNIGSFKTKFDWTDAHLQRVIIDDHTIKYEIIKNGKIVDLYCELNGIEYGFCTQTNIVYSNKPNCIVARRIVLPNQAEPIPADVDDEPINIDNNPFIDIADHQTDEEFFNSLPHLTSPILTKNEFTSISWQFKVEYGTKYFKKLKRYLSNSHRHLLHEKLTLLFDQFDYENIRKDSFTDALKIFDCFEFKNTKLTSGLVHILELINAKSATINFTSCRMTNQEMAQLCLKIPQFISQINIMDGRYLDPTVYFEIIFAYNNVTKNVYPGSLAIKNDWFPNLCMFKTKFDWRDTKLELKWVDHCTVKYEIIKYGKVVDLYFTLNGIADEYNRNSI